MAPIADYRPGLKNNETNGRIGLPTVTTRCPEEFMENLSSLVRNPRQSRSKILTSLLGCESY